MDNPEKLATLCTQDEDKQNKKNNKDLKELTLFQIYCNLMDE